MTIVRISCVTLDLVTAIDGLLELCMVNVVQRCIINIRVNYLYTRIMARIMLCLLDRD